MNNNQTLLSCFSIQPVAPAKHRVCDLRPRSPYCTHHVCRWIFTVSNIPITLAASPGHTTMIGSAQKKAARRCAQIIMQIVYSLYMFDSFFTIQGRWSIWTLRSEDIDLINTMQCTTVKSSTCFLNSQGSSGSTRWKTNSFDGNCTLAVLK